MKTTLCFLFLFLVAFGLPCFAQDGPCVDGIQQCADGTWIMCGTMSCPVQGIGPGTLNCPGDCGCPGSENNPNCGKIKPDQQAKYTPISDTMRKRILLADGIGPGTLNCPGDCGCPGSDQNPNCQTPQCPPTDYMGNPNPPCTVLGLRGAVATPVKKYLASDNPLPLCQYPNCPGDVVPPCSQDSNPCFGGGDSGGAGGGSSYSSVAVGAIVAVLTSGVGGL